MSDSSSGIDDSTMTTERTSTTMSLYVDENENRLVYPNMDNRRHAYQSTVHWHDSSNTDDSELDENLDDEKILGDGSDEDDSLLVIYQESEDAY